MKPTSTDREASCPSLCYPQSTQETAHTSGFLLFLRNSCKLLRYYFIINRISSLEFTGSSSVSCAVANDVHRCHVCHLGLWFFIHLFHDFNKVLAFYLFYLLSGSVVHLVTANDEQLTINHHFCILYLVALYISDACCRLFTVSTHSYAATTGFRFRSQSRT